MSTTVRDYLAFFLGARASGPYWEHETPALSGGMH
jgi:hypothetical protein